MDLQTNKISLFENNVFYNTWNLNKERFFLLNYILPTEDLEDVKLLLENRKSIEEYDFKKTIAKYDLEDFIQSKSAWVSQVTLYSYLKTRMGTRYVLHFENDQFMGSVNLAKWNMYAVALQDLTLFVFSDLKVNFNYHDMKNAKEIFFKILDDETTNNMPLDIIENAKKSFNERLESINWNKYAVDGDY